MSADGIMIVIGIGVVVWLLQKILNYVKAIHFMMQKEFATKYGLNDGK